MLFSKTCEIALKAVLYVSSIQDRTAGVEEIAGAISSPKFFTAKILQSLARNKILSSVKGPNGGFFMTKAQLRLTLFDVVTAVEGDDYFDRCVLGLDDCSNDHPCPVHKFFKEQKNQLRDTFRKRSIQTYIAEVRGGKAFLH